MLWDEIFKFYVIHVFGGVIGGNSYPSLIGTIFNDNDLGRYGYTDNSMIEFPFHFTGINEALYMPFGNYLSLIATIISIIIILVLMCLIVKKIFNIIFRLFTGSSLF